MDEELKIYLESMEGQLMGRIDDSNERLMERMRGIETSVLTLAELGRSTNMLLGMVVSNLTNLDGRVTRLEGKS